MLHSNLKILTFLISWRITNKINLVRKVILSKESTYVLSVLYPNVNTYTATPGPCFSTLFKVPYLCGSGSLLFISPESPPAAISLSTHSPIVVAATDDVFLIKGYKYFSSVPWCTIQIATFLDVSSPETTKANKSLFSICEDSDFPVSQLGNFKFSDNGSIKVF